MLLSTPYIPYLKYYGMEEAAAMIAEAGFDAIDFSMTGEEYCNEETETEAFQNKLREIRSCVESKGLVINQSHAPYPSDYADATQNPKAFDKIVRSIKNASVLGAKIIVVHLMTFFPEGEEGNFEALFEKNIEFYERLKPYCEQFDIKIGIENDWKWKRTYNGRTVVPAACSTPDVFCRYVDAMNSPYFVACLDLGHTLLVKQEAEDFIYKLGGDRLQALHVHDVTPYYDSHTLPYHGGMVNWDKVTEALKEIGYQGDFTYETGGFIRPLPKELLPHATQYAAEVGKYLREKIV